MNTLSRYLLSTGNLVGIAAAAAMAGLYLAGVVKADWWLLSGVAYGAGALAFYRSTPQVLQPGLDTSEYLEWLRTKAQPALPAEAAQQLGRILDMATEIWPRLKDLQAQGLVQAENRAQLKQTLTLFLPELVVNYLKLPAAYARTHRVTDYTPLQLLTYQLDLLETHVREIRDKVYAGDVDKLFAHGQFLRDKLDSTLKIG